MDAERSFRNPAGHPEPLLEPVDRALREVALRVAPLVEGLVCGSVSRALPAGPCARDDLRDVPITWQAAAALYESASSPCLRHQVGVEQRRSVWARGASAFASGRPLPWRADAGPVRSVGTAALAPHSPYSSVPRTQPRLRVRAKTGSLSARSTDLQTCLSQVGVDVLPEAWRSPRNWPWPVRAIDDERPDSVIIAACLLDPRVP